MPPRARGRRHGRRGGAYLLLTFAGAALGLLSLGAKAPALVWNFTTSVPVGLYSVSQRHPAKGDLIAIVPEGSAREALDAYGALPAGKVLLKQLRAVASDVVCRSGASITINGAEVAIARLRSYDGRALPVWRECRSLGPDEVLVLAPHPLSFDGRYFGPIDINQIIGVATPLLTFPHEGGS